MSIAAFAWCYLRITALREWLEATAAFRSARRLIRSAQSVMRDLVERWTADDTDERHVRERVRDHTRRDVLIGSRRR